MSHHHDDHECGCGGMCKWANASKDEKIATLVKKEARLQHMLDHIKKVKDALATDTAMPTDASVG